MASIELRLHAAVLEGSWALKRSLGAAGEGMALDDAFAMRQARLYIYAYAWPSAPALV